MITISCNLCQQIRQPHEINALLFTDVRDSEFTLVRSTEGSMISTKTIPRNNNMIHICDYCVKTIQGSPEDNLEDEE